MNRRGFAYMSGEKIDKLRALVSRYFPVYSTMLEGDKLVFFCEVDEESLEGKFNALRAKLREMGFIPVIKVSKGEYLIYLAPFDKREGRSIYVNLIMLILTVLSTTFAGIIHWASYTGSEDLYSLNNIVNGIIYFSFPLLLILGTHEMGHYFMARKRDVRASLPFFIPFMPPLGTMGAFISLREPIPDRKSLLDIGIAGPIAGFMVAVPVTIIGMFLGGIQAPASGAMEAGNTYMIIQVPLIYQFLTLFIPAGEFMHPMAFAGWVGFIVTAINLFPAGQLDGGHIARAALGDKATYASYGSLIALFLIGIFTGYWGWIIFGSLIFFLGIRHAPPLNDINHLDSTRKGLAVLAAVMLAISFVAVPLDTYTPEAGISLTPMDEGANLNITAYAGDEIVLNFTLENTGEAFENVSLLISVPSGWNASVFDYGAMNERGVAFKEPLESGQMHNYTLVIDIPSNASSFLYSAGINAFVSGISETMSMNILIPGEDSFSMVVLPQSTQLSPGDVAEYTCDIANLIESEQNISLSVLVPDGWNVSVNGLDTDSMLVSLDAYGEESVSFSVHVPDNTENGSYAVVALASSDSGDFQSTYLQITVVQERSST